MIEPSEKNTYVIDPESMAEMRRLHIQHVQVTTAMKGLFVGWKPQEGCKILDVACGPGGWVMEVAFAYPALDVTGVDISQRMIDYATVQANVQELNNARFQVMNVMRPLDFPDAQFDFINARFLTFFMLKDAWPHLLQELMRVCRPGGIIALTETNDAGVTNSLAFQRWFERFSKAYQLAGRSYSPSGRDAGITPMLGQFLDEVGCINIEEQTHCLNFSAGSKAHHAYYENYKVAFRLAQEFIVTMGIATRQEMNALYEQVLVEMRANTFRAHLFMLTASGRKP